MNSTEPTLRETRPTADSSKFGPAKRRFDPTQLFAQRDRLPWFWFFVAVAVSGLAAFDRYHLVQQFKHWEWVVIIDFAQIYYISLLLEFQEAKEFHA